MGGGGPTTRSGKARSRRNAIRHGLSSVTLVSVPISEVDRVARELCDVSADSRLVKLARDVARAKLFLERIETFKARLMNDWLAKADDVENSESACELLSVAASADLKLLRGLARYERNAQAQWTKACKKFEEYRDTVRAASQ